MLGRALFLRPMSIVNRQQSLQAFERALSTDPGSVDARVGIANVLVANVLDGWTTSAQQDEARAKQLLTEALERNAGSAWAHHVMAMLHRTRNELPEAKIEAEEAIALDRNYAEPITQLAMVLNHLGQPEAAIPLQEKAIRLDPQSPFLVARYWNLGLSHLLLGNVDEAVNFARRARAANPRLVYVHLLLAAALGLKGDLAEARVSLEEAIKIKPAWDTIPHLVADCTICGFGNPQFRALLDKTFFPGLRRAGLPDE